MYREELAADGSLFEGYHPRMEQVHRKNADRLRAIVQHHGWPGSNLVGEDGEEAVGEDGEEAAGGSRNTPSVSRTSCVIVLTLLKTAAGKRTGAVISGCSDGRQNQHV